MARGLKPEYVIRDLLALSTSIHLFEIFLNVLKIIHYSLLFINAAAVDRAVQIGQKSGFLAVYKLLRKIRWQHIYPFRCPNTLQSRVEKTMTVSQSDFLRLDCKLNIYIPNHI